MTPEPKNTNGTVSQFPAKTSFDRSNFTNGVVFVCFVRALKQRKEEDKIQTKEQTHLVRTQITRPDHKRCNRHIAERRISFVQGNSRGVKNSALVDLIHPTSQQHRY